MTKVKTKVKILYAKTFNGLENQVNEFLETALADRNSNLVDIKFTSDYEGSLSAYIIYTCVDYDEVYRQLDEKFWNPVTTMIYIPLCGIIVMNSN